MRDFRTNRAEFKESAAGSGPKRDGSALAGAPPVDKPGQGKQAQGQPRAAGIAQRVGQHIAPFGVAADQHLQQFQYSAQGKDGEGNQQRPLAVRRFSPSTA